MKKKKIICGVVASALALSVTLSGCGLLVSANTNADMKQTIAEVNISKADDFEKEGLTAYKDAVGTTSISKRELISYFLNVGYSYYNMYNDYKKVFNQLVNNLVDSAVITQYSVMYLLREKETEDPAHPKTATEIMNGYNAKTTLAAKYEYVLGEDSVEVKIAEYSLRAAINNAVDSYEEKILEEDDDSNAGSGTRTVPGKVGAEQEKFYPRLKDENGNYLDGKGNVVTDKDKAAIDYNVYTGYAGYELTNSGAYQDDALEGTTESTRKRAYVNFLASVNSYNLIDVKTENMKDVRSLRYIEDEYVNQLETQITNKYYEVYESKLESHIKDEDKEVKYEYIDKAYQDKLKVQKDNYKAEGFTSTLDSMSDESFILYSPQTEGHGVYDSVENGKFGFVYNILLPFSAAQSADLSELKAKYADEDEDSGYTQDYYYLRNQLLKEIQTTDQRAAWFNGSTEYAFNATEKGLKFYKNENNSDWLFFENNLVESDKYEKLEKYAGLYPYNGKVFEKDNGYKLIPNKLTIDDMLQEFSDYIDYVLNGSGNVTCSKTMDYYEIKNFYSSAHDKDETDTKLDYSKFLYASGNVNGVQAGTPDQVHAALYNKDSAQYKVLSAVNELQYAYTTDTGVLSNYVGYSVDAADTNYIKEFEYAAQYAINEYGAGGFAVCAGDYGWHLIYVTYTLEAGEQYTPDWTKIDAEGDSFEKLFYEMIKSQDVSNIQSKRESEIRTQFNIGKTVTKYQKAYQDLLDLG